MLDIKSITEKSVARTLAQPPQGFGHALEAWSLLEWAGAACGELGEATNIAKKMDRFDKGFASASFAGVDYNTLREHLAEEMGDAFHYMILLAARAGIDLEQAIVDSFNNKSKQIGSTILLERARYVRAPLGD